MRSKGVLLLFHNSTIGLREKKFWKIYQIKKNIYVCMYIYICFHCPTNSMSIGALVLFIILLPCQFQYFEASWSFPLNSLLLEIYFVDIYGTNWNYRKIIKSWYSFEEAWETAVVKNILSILSKKRRIAEKIDLNIYTDSE